MGTMIHDAIVVTVCPSASPDLAQKAQLLARQLGLQATELITSPVNDYVSFMIAPDGSKEHWPDSDKADEARAKWSAWARRMSGLEFAHVRFGEIDGENEGAELFNDSYTSP